MRLPIDEKVFESEQEWRRAMWARLDKIEDRINQVAGKMYFISGSVGAVVAVIMDLVKKN